MVLSNFMAHLNKSAELAEQMKAKLHNLDEPMGYISPGVEPTIPRLSVDVIPLIANPDEKTPVSLYVLLDNLDSPHAPTILDSTVLGDETMDGASKEDWEYEED